MESFAAASFEGSANPLRTSPMTRSDSKKAITDLVAQVMRLQKRYAHEQVGVKTERRNEVKKIVNRVASEMEQKDGS